MRSCAVAGFSVASRGPRFFSILCLSIAAVSAPAVAHGDTATMTSRYTRLGDCDEVDHGDIDKGEDWIFHRCEGYDGIPVWLLYVDSSRAQVGFGSTANVTGPFGIDRDDEWPIEWRGNLDDGRFQPITAIIRMPRPFGEGIELIVYRLRTDGTSCIVGSTSGSNETARRIADAAIGSFECLEEPYLP
jgi:hypothetical protein